MTVPRPTLRNIELRPVSIPLKRPVVSKVVLFERWPLARIDLSHRGGHHRAQLPRAISRALDALIRPRHSRSGRSAQGPTDATTRRFPDESRRAELIGIEGVSMIAVSGARHGRLEAQVQIRPDGLDPSFRRREATRQDGRDRKRG
jgi:mandelate racemase